LEGSWFKTSPVIETPISTNKPGMAYRLVKWLPLSNKEEEEENAIVWKYEPLPNGYGPL
jgi:hypothetical protein